MFVMVDHELILTNAFAVIHLEISSMANININGPHPFSLRKHLYRYCYFMLMYLDTGDGLP